MKDITEYMNQSIEKIIKDAISIKKNNIKQLLFLYSFNTSSKRASKRRKEYEAKGVHIPPFLIASIAKECNLRCVGCYSIANKACNPSVEQLSADRWSEIFEEAQKIGVGFILLAGGEPLMRKDVIMKASENKKIAFPIFTNGTLIDDEWVKVFDKNRNLIPILSIEGDRQITDERRGAGVYDQLILAMKKLQSKKVLYGVSITVSKNNLAYVTGDTFIDLLNDNGCSIAFYVEYVPAEKNTEGMVLTIEDRESLLQKLDTIRDHKPIIAIAFPGDEKYMGGCLAAGRGFFHINSNGNAEPCPFSPFSDMTLKNCSLIEALESPLFKKLQSSELLETYHSGGCVLFENASLVKQISMEL